MTTDTPRRRLTINGAPFPPLPPSEPEPPTRLPPNAGPRCDPFGLPYITVVVPEHSSYYYAPGEFGSLAFQCANRSRGSLLVRVYVENA